MHALPFTSADDCFELGRQAFHAGYYDYALSWMEEAQSKSVTNADETKDQSGLTNYLKMSEVS